MSHRHDVSALVELLVTGAHHLLTRGQAVNDLNRRDESRVPRLTAVLVTVPSA
jgi:hypothetical protein